MFKVKDDKLLHFFVSGYIFLFLCNYIPIEFAFMFTFLVGLCKEIYDWKYKDNADINDIFANILGILFSFLAFI